MCPKQVAPITAGNPKPPNILGDGIAGAALGFLIVNLAIAIAKMLQTIITIATVGVHSKVLGAAVSKRVVIKVVSPFKLLCLNRYQKFLPKNSNQ